jgi:hypothetical protein
MVRPETLIKFSIIGTLKKDAKREQKQKVIGKEAYYKIN